MAASCPEASSLPQFCVGGQFSPVSCDLTQTPDIRVILRLVDSAGKPAEGITDPTSCSEFMAGTTEEIHVGSSGCWCICVPFANYSSVDPLNAAHPTGTFWEVRLFSGNAAEGEWSPLGKPRVFQIDADHDYAATCGTCAPYGTSCGSCIPISCLLNPTGTVPTTIDDQWCDAVMGCVAPAIADLQAQIDALEDTDTFVTFTENPDGSISSTLADGTPGPTWPPPTVNTDTDTFVTFGVDGDGNVTTSNADGTAGPTLCPAPCEDTNTTNASVTLAPGAGGTLEVTVTDSDGNDQAGQISCADLAAILTPCLPAGVDTDTFVTFGTDGDGNVTTVNADGTAGPTLCPAPCSGTDTDTFVTFGVDGDGNITTTNADGTAGPTLCPAPCTGGDPVVLTYVAYNPATHVAGPIVGAGTTASPYEIPLPGAATADLCDQLNALPDATEAIQPADEVLVVQADGTCARKTTETCAVEITSGGTAFTGTAVGMRTFSCAIVAMPTETNPAGGTDWDPEIDFPAADFPIGWEQVFSGGFTGHEIWTVMTLLDDTTHQWVKVTA